MNYRHRAGPELTGQDSKMMGRILNSDSGTENGSQVGEKLPRMMNCRDIGRWRPCSVCYLSSLGFISTCLCRMGFNCFIVWIL